MRLIDADEIRKKAVPHTMGEHGYNANIRKWAVLVGDIDDAPTIDPASLRSKGEWDRNGYCSVCDFWTCYCGDYNFCPNCGCDMRRVDNG